MKALLTILSLAVPRLCYGDLQITSYVIETSPARLSEWIATGKTGNELFAIVQSDIQSDRVSVVDTSLVRTGARGSALLRSDATRWTPEHVDIVSAPNPLPSPQTPVPRAEAPFTPETPIDFITTHPGVSWSVNTERLSHSLIKVFSEWKLERLYPPSVLFQWKDELSQDHPVIRRHTSVADNPRLLIAASSVWNLLSAQSAFTDGGSVDSSRKWVTFLRVDDLDAAGK